MPLGKYGTNSLAFIVCCHKVFSAAIPPGAKICFAAAQYTKQSPADTAAWQYWIDKTRYA